MVRHAEGGQGLLATSQAQRGDGLQQQQQQQQQQQRRQRPLEAPRAATAANLCVGSKVVRNPNWSHRWGDLDIHPPRLWTGTVLGWTSADADAVAVGSSASGMGGTDVVAHGEGMKSSARRGWAGLAKVRVATAGRRVTCRTSTHALHAARPLVPDERYLRRTVGSSQHRRFSRQFLVVVCAVSL
eukprot:COSAG01_NODE_1379_length_10522_cov_25.951454_5_plen_185_part_00